MNVDKQLPSICHILKCLRSCNPMDSSGIGVCLSKVKHSHLTIGRTRKTQCPLIIVEFHKCVCSQMIYQEGRQHIAESSENCAQRCIAPNPVVHL